MLLFGIRSNFVKLVKNKSVPELYSISMIKHKYKGNINKQILLLSPALQISWGSPGNIGCADKCRTSVFGKDSNLRKAHLNHRKRKLKRLTMN